MKKGLYAAVAAVLVAAPVLVLAFAPAPDAGSHPVEHKAVNGYAESRDSGLKGDASFLAVTSKAEFSRIFDPVITPRGAPDPVAKDAFDTRLFVAVIKRDEVLWDYKVEKVTANGDTLTVQYTATPGKGAPVPRGGATMRAPIGISSAKGTTVREGISTAKAIATGRATTEKAPAATQKGETRAARGETKKEASKATGIGGGTTQKVAIYTTGRAGGRSAAFDSPLILSVPKDKYLTVVFIENGKKVGSARVGN
jgi:hypothetical protein